MILKAITQSAKKAVYRSRRLVGSTASFRVHLQQNNRYQLQ